MKVALIERGRFGGTCVNTGCTPTKTMVASAYARSPRPPCRRVRCDDRGAGQGRFSSGSGASRGGRGPLASQRGEVAPRNVRLHRDPGAREVRGPGHAPGRRRARRCPARLPRRRRPRQDPEAAGRRGRAVPHQQPLLALDTLPRHLMVVGGGYVGLEFTQMFRRFGAEVTLIEMSERLLRREDEDVAEAVVSILEGEGVTRAHRRRVHPPRPSAGRGQRPSSTASRAPPTWSAHTSCLAVGRSPNTHDLGLDRAGVATDAHGYITVDGTLRSNVPGSGRSATATAGAPSLTPRTTTSRSWPRTCSTDSNAA